MIKRADLLIDDARKISQADEWTATSGISDEVLIRQLNNAKLRLQRLITVTQARPNMGYYEVDIVANYPSGTESVPVPPDLFMTNLIYDVEYSVDGSVTSYQTLTVMYERGDNRNRSPLYYMVEGNNIYFDSLVTTGKVRINYEKTLSNLDIRRGQVDSYTATPPPGYITLYRGAAGKIDPSDDALALAPDYICCVDRAGNVKSLNLQMDYYDPATSRIYLLSAPGVGESIPNSSFIVTGSYTTTHPQGPDIFGDYYIEFLHWEIEKVRSKSSSKDESDKLQSIAEEIVELYDQLPAGNTMVPIMRRD